MKSFLIPALIALSLGLNALIIVGLASPATVAPLVALVRPGGTTSSAPAPATRNRENPSAVTGAAPSDRTGAKWADLRSDDPATLIANLRAAGFSDVEIRAILAQQLGEKVTARRRELAGPPVDTPWWRGTIGLSSSTLITNPQAQAELRAMSQANSKLLDSLLGPSPVPNTNPTDRLQYADLPSDKVDQLKQILADYSDLTNAIQLGSLGATFPEDRAKLKLLNDEKDKDIRALLSPEEYESYQLRSSSTAQTMRNNLQLFQPTEEEFRRIYALQSAFDQQYNQVGGIDLELARQRSQAQTELTAQIKAALAPDRVADYEKSTDGTYRQAVALVTRLELPKENATQLWSLQKETQQQLTALRTDRTLSADARNQALAALQQQVASRATGVLGGPRGYDAYKQNGGQWIQSIVPTPVAPGAATGGGGAVIINSGGFIFTP
jgi:hypothetical protein